MVVPFHTWKKDAKVDLYNDSTDGGKHPTTVSFDSFHIQCLYQFYEKNGI